MTKHNLSTKIVLAILIATLLFSFIPPQDALAANQIQVWTQIGSTNGTYKVEAVVSPGASIQNIPLDATAHANLVHALYVRDPNNSMVTNTELSWQVVLAAQNALEYKNHGWSDLTAWATRPINFSGLTSETRSPSGGPYLIRTVFESGETTNNNLLFSTGFGTRGLDNPSYRRGLYQKLILSMVFQQEIQNDLQDPNSLEYQRLKGVMVKEAQEVIDAYNEGASITIELVNLAKYVVYGTNAVSRDLLGSPAVFSEWENLAKDQAFKETLNQFSEIAGYIQIGTQFAKPVFEGMMVNLLATEEAGLRMALIESFVQHESYHLDPQLINAAQDARTEFDVIRSSTWSAMVQVFLDNAGTTFTSFSLFAVEKWGPKFLAKYTSLTMKQANNIFKAFGPALEILKICFELEEDLDVLRLASLGLTMDYYLNQYMSGLPDAQTVPDAMQRGRLYNLRYFLGYYYYEYQNRALSNSWYDTLFLLNLAYMFAGHGSGYADELQAEKSRNLNMYRASMAPNFMAMQDATWLRSLIDIPSSPSLSSPTIAPANSGDTSTNFQFSVRYVHPQDIAPNSISVVIDSTIELALSSTDPTFTDGAIFTSSPRAFTTGVHNYYFKAMLGSTVIQTNPLNFYVNTPVAGHNLTLTTLNLSRTSAQPGNSVTVTGQINNNGVHNESNVSAVTRVTGPGSYSWTYTQNIGTLNAGGIWGIGTLATWSIPSSAQNGEYLIQVTVNPQNGDENWSDNTQTRSVYVSNEAPIVVTSYRYAVKQLNWTDNPPLPAPFNNWGAFGPGEITVGSKTYQVWTFDSGGGWSFYVKDTNNTVYRDFYDNDVGDQETDYDDNYNLMFSAPVLVPSGGTYVWIKMGYKQPAATISPGVQNAEMGVRVPYTVYIPCSNCSFSNKKLFDADNWNGRPPSENFHTVLSSYSISGSGQNYTVNVAPPRVGVDAFAFDTNNVSSLSSGAENYMVFAKINGYTPVDNPPAALINYPIQNLVVSGAVNFSATASDDRGITKVEFYVDAALKATDTTSPYSYGWDSTIVADGSHTLMIKAYDTAGQTQSPSITVTVDNLPPVISGVSHSPASPTNLTPVTVQANLADASGISTAILKYSRNAGSTWTSLTMTNSSGNTWQATIPAHDNGDVLHKIEATDSQSRTAASSNSTYHISDVSAPTFIGWLQNPSNITEDSLGAVRVTVQIMDTGGSGMSATPPGFDYRIGATSYNGYEAMTLGGENTWFFDIPSGDWNALRGQTLYYKAQAGDAVGNSATSTEKSDLIDSISDSPQIETASPNYLQINLTPGTCQDFQITASDADNDDLSYSWKLDNTPVGSGQTYTYCSPAQDSGTHSVAVSVSDGSLQATRTWQVTIPSANGPEMDVKGNNVSITDDDTTPSPADHTDFGSLDVSTGTLARPFTIYNTGNSTLTLNGSPKVSVTGCTGFTVSVQPATSTVIAGGSTAFTITFDPSVLGTCSGTVSISNTDSDENPYNFSIQGLGTTTTPEMDVKGKGVSIANGDSTPSRVDDTDFGNVNITSGAIPHTFTIYNTGSANLLLNGSPKVAVIGTNATDFTVNPQPASPVSGSSGSTTFTVTFNPNALGPRTATISIANNDSNENPYTFTIQGMGTSDSTCGTLLFADDFSIDKGWTDGSGGTVVRDTTNQWLNWDARRDTPLHYYYPLYAQSGKIQLELRFRATNNSGNGMVWFGLAESLTDVLPNVAAADKPGFFFSPDSSKKIQVISLYSDRSNDFVDGNSSTLSYGSYNTWRRAILTIEQLNWKIEIKDDIGTLLSQMTGVLPKQHGSYNYAMVMFNYEGGWEHMTGNIDDLKVYGCASTIFEDHFTDDEITIHPAWTANNSAYAVVDGVLHSDGLHYDGSGRFLNGFNSHVIMPVDDYLEFSYRGLLKSQGSPQTGLGTQLILGSNQTDKNYALNIQRGETNGFPTNKYSLSLTYGSLDTISDLIVTDFQPNYDQFYDIKAVRANGQWSLYVDGTLIGTAQDSGAFNVLEVVVLYTVGSVSVDDIRVATVPSNSPVVNSIVRTNENPTNSDSVGFLVTFSKSVTGVSTTYPFSDFTLTTTGITGTAISNVNGLGSSYLVTVNTGAGNGTIRLDVVDDNTIIDVAGNRLGGVIAGDGDFTMGETYTITKDVIFGDVPSDYWARSFIERLYNAGITGGCGTSPLKYCPDTTVTRSQMAVFLLRGIHSSSYGPPAVGSSTGFGDVPVDYWSAVWIKQLAAEGITGGCGSGNYCPEYPVTRDQMAVFLLRSKYGSSYSPPGVGTNTGFGDVPVDHWAAPWIKQLVTEGITAGCGSGNYCPRTPVSRAQMAVFLVRTFNLP